MDYYAEIARLFHDANITQDPYVAQASLKKAVQLSAAAKDEWMEFDARTQLLMLSFRTGFHDLSLSNFPWIKAFAKKNEEQIYPVSVMVMYMAVLNGITEFPHISLGQIRGVVDEMIAYYKEANYGLREPYTIARHVFLEMGKEKEANEYLDLAHRSVAVPAVHACRSCELFGEITYLDHLGKYEMAISQAETLIREDAYCEYQQQVPYAALLTSYWRLGKHSEAVAAFQKMADKINRLECNHLWYAYKFLFFYVLAYNLDRAKLTIEKFMPRAVKGHAKALTFLFYQGFLLYLDVMLQNGKAKVALRLPTDFTVHAQNGEYDIIELRQWAQNEVNQLAKLFDQRAQNHFFSDLHLRHMQFLPMVSEYPLNLE